MIKFRLVRIGDRWELAVETFGEIWVMIRTFDDFDDANKVAMALNAVGMFADGMD